jgi:hypothetical protein
MFVCCDRGVLVRLACLLLRRRRVMIALCHYSAYVCLDTLWIVACCMTPCLPRGTLITLSIKASVGNTHFCVSLIWSRRVMILDGGTESRLKWCVSALCPAAGG